LPRA